MRSGVINFYEWMRKGHGEWAILAVRAPIEAVARTLIELRAGADPESFSTSGRWQRDVAIRAGRDGDFVSDLVPLVQLRGHAWTVAVYDMFHLSLRTLCSAPEDARGLSGRLGATAIEFSSEDTSGATGYRVFEGGDPVESAEWGSGRDVFSSTRRPRPPWAALPRDFPDEVFREYGLYIPSCYAPHGEDPPCVAIDAPEADAIERADLLDLRGCFVGDLRRALALQEPFAEVHVIYDMDTAQEEDLDGQERRKELVDDPDDEIPFLVGAARCWPLGPFRGSPGVLTARRSFTRRAARSRRTEPILPTRPRARRIGGSTIASPTPTANYRQASRPPGTWMGSGCRSSFDRPRPCGPRRRRSAMSEIWDRIEAWLRVNAPEILASLRPGATDGRIDEAERSLGITFPEPVRDSYRVHDGQRPDGGGLIEGWEFLSLERIEDEWKLWRGLLEGGDFRGIASEPDDGIRPDWWNPRWIPLTYDGAGDHHCLDLDPAPGGEVGHIIEMWHDEPSRPLVARSYREWLEGFAADLEARLYVHSEDYGGLVERDKIGEE